MYIEAPHLHLPNETANAQLFSEFPDLLPTKRHPHGNFSADA
jgi:hypothetical protein